MFQQNELIIYFLVISMLLSSTLVRISIRLARLFNFYDFPVNGRKHDKPIPLTGGGAMFVAVILMTVGHVLVLWIAEPYLPSFFRKLLPNPIAPRAFLNLTAILAGATMVFLVGLVDDRRKIGVLPRLGVQILAATGIVSCGIYPSITGVPEPLMMVIMVFWIVGVTNAFNLLDGIDGLCASVAAVALFNFFLYAGLTSQWLVMPFVAVLLGTVLGYLQQNWHPARVYMGSSGSLFLGFLLACTPLVTDFYQDGTPYRMLFLPPLILSVPLYDTLSVILIRVMSGRKAMQADRNHLHHRLRRLGLSIPQTVGAVSLLGLATGVMALLLPTAGGIEATIILLSVLSMFCVFILLERVHVRGADRSRRHNLPLRCRRDDSAGELFEGLARTLTSDWIVVAVDRSQVAQVSGAVGEGARYIVELSQDEKQVEVSCRLMGVQYDEENEEYTASFAPLVGAEVTVQRLGRVIQHLTYPARGV